MVSGGSLQQELFEFWKAARSSEQRCGTAPAEGLEEVRSPIDWHGRAFPPGVMRKALRL